MIEGQTAKQETLTVNIQHLKWHDYSLAESVEIEWLRYEPQMRQAVQRLVREQDPEFVKGDDQKEREFYIAWEGINCVDRLRDLRSAKVCAAGQQSPEIGPVHTINSDKVVYESGGRPHFMERDSDKDNRGSTRVVPCNIQMPAVWRVGTQRRAAICHDNSHDLLINGMWQQKRLDSHQRREPICRLAKGQSSRKC